jgi:hypothetical protein
MTSNLSSIWGASMARAADNFAQAEPLTERQTRALQQVVHSAWLGAVSKVDIPKETADAARDAVLRAAEGRPAA